MATETSPIPDPAGEPRGGLTTQAQVGAAALAPRTDLAARTWVEPPVVERRWAAMVAMVVRAVAAP